MIRPLRSHLVIFQSFKQWFSIVEFSQVKRTTPLVRGAFFVSSSRCLIRQGHLSTPGHHSAIDHALVQSGLGLGPPSDHSFISHPLQTAQFAIVSACQPHIRNGLLWRPGRFVEALSRWWAECSGTMPSEPGKRCSRRATGNGARPDGEVRLDDVLTRLNRLT